MVWKSRGGDTVLSKAAKSDSEDTVEAVVAALGDKLTAAEVKVRSSTSLVSPRYILHSSWMAHPVRSIGKEYYCYNTANYM